MLPRHSRFTDGWVLYHVETLRTGQHAPSGWKNFVAGGTYFFTVALLERKRDLLVAEVAALREAVRRVKRLYPFDIVAWVVLPDHLHCSWTLPAGEADYPTRWRLIKLLFAKGLPKQERLSAVHRRVRMEALLKQATTNRVT